MMNVLSNLKLLKENRYYKGFALLSYDINRLELEVIGNIHENADLLENEE